MSNDSTVYVLMELQKKRQTAMLHVEARLAVLRSKEATYAALGQAREFYAIKLRLVDEQEAIRRDLEEYAFMIRDAESCAV